jgi:MFS transporter, DHA1 family, staphyloferrin A biosynthesis exporter
LSTSKYNKTSLAAFGSKLLSSLKNPSYRIYFLATIAHFAAMSMQIFANPLLIYRLTDSSALLGTMSLVGAAPMIAVSAFGGAFADRLQKKWILVIGLFCSAIVASGIGLALATGSLNSENPASWWILIIASFIQGIIMGLMMPALQAIIPEIISREQLMNAIAMNTLGMNALNFIAPIVAGFVIESFDFQAVYFTMSVLYVGAAIFILFLPAKSRITTSGSNIMADISQGFRYIRKDSLIIFILAFTLIVVVLSMPYQQLMPIFADDILKVGAKGMGTLMGVAGAGALIGSIILAALPNKKRGILLLGSGILAGIALIVFSFSSRWILSLAVIFFIGLAQTFRMTIGNALLQAYTQDTYMGRVMSILNMQWGFMSVCTFVAGILAEVVPVQWVLGSLAMLLTVLSILCLSFFPGIRKVD